MFIFTWMFSLKNPVCLLLWKTANDATMMQKWYNYDATALYNRVIKNDVQGRESHVWSDCERKEKRRETGKTLERAFFCLFCGVDKKGV